MSEFDFAGKRVAVVGMARSGLPAARLAQQLGAHVLVSDLKPAVQLQGAIQDMDALGIETETGSHQRLSEERFDLIVLSPGVNPSSELLSKWHRAGTAIWSELMLAASLCQNRWIAVTGSNGKTTTVHLITECLRRAGMNAIMAGNVGKAWTGFLPADPDTVFVVEVSSFQLEFAEQLKPPVAVLLNLYENHLDRHGTMEVYAQLKSRLFQNQQGDDVAVLNGDDFRVTDLARNFRSRLVRFGCNPSCEFRVANDAIFCRMNDHEELLIELAELPLLGRHNAMNAVAAAAAAVQFGVPLEAIRTALQEAKAVEHRIEFVREVNGIRYFNDSKSTNMVATITALDAFTGNVILLFGGRPKKESFAPLALRFPRPLKHIVAFGEAVSKVIAELPQNTALVCAPDLREALKVSHDLAVPGDIVLLSPGCTSFDQFSDYEERGRTFKELVNRL